MLKRIQKKNDEYLNQFKILIKDKMVEYKLLDTEEGRNVLQFIYDFENLQYTKEDFQKRKRVKNSVPLCDRCSALKAEGIRCTRRRKGQHAFCGTHLKGTPHGVVNTTEEMAPNLYKTIQIWAEEVNGIVCHIDDKGNVYDPQDIHQNIKNPKVIAKYKKELSGKITVLN